MNKHIARALALPLVAFLSAGLVQAKLPALSDEAKAKAAETSAKTAWTNQVANFQLCKSMDKVAVAYVAQVKKSGKEVKPATATPPCADPGVFSYAPPVAAAAVPAAGTAVAIASPASPAAPASAKK